MLNVQKKRELLVIILINILIVLIMILSLSSYVIENNKKNTSHSIYEAIHTITNVSEQMDSFFQYKKTDLMNKKSFLLESEGMDSVENAIWVLQKSTSNESYSYHLINEDYVGYAIGKTSLYEGLIYPSTNNGYDYVKGIMQNVKDNMINDSLINVIPSYINPINSEKVIGLYTSIKLRNNFNIYEDYALIQIINVKDIISSTIARTEYEGLQDIIINKNGDFIINYILGSNRATSYTNIID